MLCGRANPDPSGDVVNGVLERVDGLDREQYDSEFTYRVTRQNAVYLLQNGFDIPFNFSFSKYFRGPYSPKLQRKLLDSDHSPDTVTKRRFVDDALEERFQQFCDAVEPADDPAWLEYAALAVMWREDDEAVRRDRVKAVKPRFNEETWDDVNTVLGEHDALTP